MHDFVLTVCESMLVYISRPNYLCFKVWCPNLQFAYIVYLSLFDDCFSKTVRAAGAGALGAGDSHKDSSPLTRL